MSVKQAKSWAEVQVHVDSLAKKVAEIPPPPQPRDSWSEKVNALYRDLEGLTQQVRSEVEMEDMRNETGGDDE